MTVSERILDGYAGFDGKVTVSGFELALGPSSLTNRTRVLIAGEVTGTQLGSRIAVTLRLPRFVTGFLVTWLVCLGAACLVLGLVSLVTLQLEPALMVLAPMVIVGYAFTMLPYWAVVGATKRLLIGVLDATTDA
jgi:hypothetical protein